MSKKISKILIPVFLVITGLIIGGGLIFIYQGKDKTSSENFLSPQKAAQKAIDYINENMMEAGDIASLVDVTEENGLYKFKLKVGGDEYDSYITIDGELLFFQGISLNPPSKKDIPKAEIPEANLFVMAFCPFGNQAEEIMMPVQELLGEKANIELHYIVYSNYASGYPQFCLDKENKYCSMHGIGELNQGIREICVQKYQKDKLWDFVMKINRETTSENVDESWEEVAKNLGIDIQEIKVCEANESETLLAREVNLNKIEYPVQDPTRHQDQEEMSISGSPTLAINGIIYDGERSSEAYKEAICSGFLNPPSECSQKLETETGDAGEC